MRHHRAYPLGCDERRSGPRALPLGDCEPRCGRQHDSGHDVVRRRDILDKRAGQGEFRLGCGEISSLHREKCPLGARRPPRPGRSARDGRVGSLTQNGLRLVDLPRKQQSPSPRRTMETGYHWLVSGNWESASSASIRICSTPSLQSKARTVASPGLERGPVRHRPPRSPPVSTASAQRSAASGRPRNTCTHTPSTAITGNCSSRSGSSKLRQPALDRGHAAAPVVRPAARALDELRPLQRCRPLRSEYSIAAFWSFVRNAPRGRSATESQRELGLASLQLRLQHLPEQMVVAEPAARRGRERRRKDPHAPAARAFEPSRHAPAPRRTAKRTSARARLSGVRTRAVRALTRLSSSARR